MPTLTTQQQYNKIFHDWVVRLTGLNGANVRPQKHRYGFTLTEPNGKPISFDSLVAMFFCTMQGDDQTKMYSDTNKAEVLQHITLNVTFVGEEADKYANQIQALAQTEQSMTYLKGFGIAIQGEPTETPTDHRYGIKYFYRKTVNFDFNQVVGYTIPNSTGAGDIESVPTETKITY